MKLIVWNSQGNKWNPFWTNFLGPERLKSSDEEVVGLLVEAGWAPWVDSGKVKLGSLYQMPTGHPAPDWYSERNAIKSAFCMGISGDKSRAFWTPWQWNLEGNTNTRCSMGATTLGDWSVEQTSIDDDRFLRPVIRLTFSVGKIDKITVLLVHCISSQRKAEAEFTALVSATRKMISEGKPAIIVGDMNIDLLKKTVTPPKDWVVL